MGRTATILIVDDEERNRRLLELMLLPEGYRTVAVADGQEALAAVAGQPIDLILLDMMMPAMSGHEVAGLLKADPLTKVIPIIMVTSLADRQARLAALAAGVEEFLTKPVDRAELWLRVRNLLRLKEYGDIVADRAADLERRVAERAADLQRFRMAMDSTADAIFLTDRATMTFLEVNATASAMLGYSHDELIALGPLQLHVEPAGDLARSFDAIISGDVTESLVRTTVRCKNGDALPVEVRRHARRSGDDWIIVAVLRDITDQEAAEERLQQLAHYDGLTGLPNRALVYETLERTLPVAARRNWRVVVMFLDVDHFKNVNDTLGHALGDNLLEQIGRRLVGCVRLRDTVGRLGGDEFALILTMADDELGGATAVASKIRAALQQPFELAGHRLGVTASIGITMYPSDATSPATLLTYADTAMYGAKRAGRDTFRYFKPQMNSDVLMRLQLEQALRDAIQNEEFVLHYQPKVRLDSGRIAGLEALLRWNRPGHGLIPPNQFIPRLEEMGLIREVGTWVIGEACRQIVAWAGGEIGPMSVAVNVSGKQFFGTDLDAEVGAALLRYGAPAEALELELTESTLMANTEQTVGTLERLKARGVRVSIDDFGTGYSCLAYLGQFPIDKLKIDIAFIRDVISSPAAAAMTETIIRMAHRLQLDVIAEGVETAGQLSYLARHGCDQIQGYYFSRPLPLAAVEELLRAGTTLARPGPAGSVPRTTVLLVDDDAETVAALERLLRPDGYQILTACSADAGLEILAAHHVQVIVCDRNLRCAARAGFPELVKDLYPDSLRIVLSERSDSRVVIDAVNRGGLQGFHAKPWDDDALRDSVREACRQHQRRHNRAAAAGAPAPILSSS